ncbi:Cytochrome P450 6k1 [Blattella germanica]|nr:Cytochrome P450 6k1 [Blattella germanica]
MSFTLYQLALNPDIQKRLSSEIREVIQKNNNEVTYEVMQKMKYLDMAVNETLRLYPILPFLDRKCLSDYDIPAPSGKGTVTIPAGTAVYIPLIGIQYDPEYFPDPEKYDPERFTEENKQSRPAYTHMPFGEGPRMCIGSRFAFMQTKSGLIHILSRYEVSPCKDTPIPLILDKRSFLLSTTTGIPLTFKRIQT